MTTTSTFLGMDEGAKPSSRVLRPPGGGSSNIFGGCAEPTDPKPAGVANTPKKDGLIYGSTLPPGEGEPAASKKPARKGQFNPITGQPYEQGQAENNNDDKKEEVAASTTAPANDQTPDSKLVHTSTKVRQPPGGASSGLW